MKNLVFLFIIWGLSVVFPGQKNKYLIYFKDKGNLELLRADSLLKEKIIKSLSSETINRRKNVLGENIITYDDFPVNKKYIEVLKKKGIKISKILNWFNAVSSYLTNKQLQIVEGLKFVKKVEGVKKLNIIIPVKKEKEEKSLNKSVNSLNKYDYGKSLKQMKLSDVPQLHNIGITGSNVVIGLIDAGFKTSGVPALEGRNIIERYDFVQKDTVTENQTGDHKSQHEHGTKVFSVCGGFKEGELIGPAFDAKFLLAKTENIAHEKNIEEDNFAAACEWMEKKGARIVSSSLGYNQFDSGEKSYKYQDMNGKTTISTKAFNKLFDLGVVTIVSAGNEGNKSWKYITSPADAFNCITVGAVDTTKKAAGFSSFGPTSDGRPKPEISAMGSRVLGNSSSGSYLYLSGTSFSTPIVAGITGQLLSVFPHLKNTQVRHIILNSGEHPYKHDNQRGYGLISAKRAVEFPNIEKLSENFRLHKVFINSNGIKSGSAKVYILKDGNNEKFDLIKGNKDYKFYLDLQNYGNSNLEIYFTYTDNKNNLIREPISRNYNLKYGSLNITSIKEKITTKNKLPNSYILNQNYPNPFNPITTISYEIKKEGNGKIEIFDILGQKIKTLVNKYHNSGGYEIKLQSSDLKNFASGVYFYRLTINGFSQTKKMILIK